MVRTTLAPALLLAALCDPTAAFAVPSYNIATLGFYGPEHTRDDGYKYSYPFELNEAGQATGYSDLYNGGSSQLGISSWLYDGTTTIDIGLVDSVHTRDDGYKYSYPFELNEAGQVVGWSYRYDGGNTWGQHAWLYDPVLDQTFPFELSSRSDGYTSSTPDYFGEDGLVLGHYALYDELDDYLGTRVFYFTIADGLHDLGSLVNGGLSANGWDFLADTIRANGLDQILGFGDVTSQMGGHSVNLLTPIGPGLAGDYNGDGVVDAADYTVWRDAMENEALSLLNRDPSRENGTDYVDEDDYAFWRANFGMSVGSGAGAPISPSVPEPSTLLLLSLSALEVAALRRRRGTR